MGNHRFKLSGLSQWENGKTYSAKPLSLSTGKKGKPGAHFNGKSHIHNTWLISGEINQKKLNSTGKKAQPGTHFNGKYLTLLTSSFQIHTLQHLYLYDFRSGKLELGS